MSSQLSIPGRLPGSMSQSQDLRLVTKKVSMLSIFIRKNYSKTLNMRNNERLSNEWQHLRRVSQITVLLNL